MEEGIRQQALGNSEEKGSPFLFPDHFDDHPFAALAVKLGVVERCLLVLNQRYSA